MVFCFDLFSLPTSNHAKNLDDVAAPECFVLVKDMPSI